MPVRQFPIKVKHMFCDDALLVKGRWFTATVIILKMPKWQENIYIYKNSIIHMVTFDFMYLNWS